MTVRLKVAVDLMTSCVSSEVRPFVALEHLESGTGRLVSDVELPERTAPDTGAASVEPGDVLFGKLRPYLAKTWLADRPVFASTELLCLRPRAGVDSRWLAYLVASNPVVEWAVATSDGTKMPRTSWEKLAEYRIGIPPIAEQRAIADYSTGRPPASSRSSRPSSAEWHYRKLVWLQRRRVKSLDVLIPSRAKTTRQDHYFRSPRDGRCEGIRPSFVRSLTFQKTVARIS